MKSDADVQTSGSGAGMATLFTTEMWERFSFYGMKALLVPFLMATFGYDEPAAREILGVYILLVYLSPLFAGIITDRFMNLRMSIYVGAMVMALGHFAMAFQSFTFVGMALIIVGNGFFKPCATNMVGALYPEGHSWRSSAYSLFYFGINLGGFISPFVCGWLRDSYGFHWGFAAAGVGMIFGLITFWMFEEKLKLTGLRKEEQERLFETRRIDNRSWRTVWIAVVLTTILIGSLAHFRYFLNFVWTPTWLLGGGISAIVLFGVRMAVVVALLYLYTKFVPKTAVVRKLESIEKDRIWVVLAVTFAMFFLVIALEQAGGTLNLFAKDKTQPDIFGIKFPYEFYQSVNPLWVMVLSLFTMWLWPKLEKRGVRDTHKLGPGLMFVAVVFFLLQAAQAVTAGGAKASPLWLIVIYGIIAAGEVCISVVGLSVVNKLAPEHMKAFFIAVFFMSISVGGYLAGTIDQILGEIGLSPWKTLAWTCVAASVIYTLLAGKLRKLSHGVL